MDPETKQLLVEMLAIARENNQMLQKMARAQMWASVSRYIYWALIILSFFGSYFFLQPYLSSILNLYSGGAGGGASNVSDILKGLDAKKLQEEINNISH